MEVFKDINGFEGFYQVSDLGNVKSVGREILKNGKYPFWLKEKLLTPSLNEQGYYRVGLMKQGKVKTKQIHLLVAEMFLNHIPNGNKVVVDHINNIKTDNRKDNLQIITQRLNASKDRINNTSKYVGVSWNKQRGMWLARIRIENKRKYLGYFSSEIEASKAYQKALSDLTK